MSNNIPLFISIGVSGHRKTEQLRDSAKLKDVIQSEFIALKKRLSKKGNEVNFLLISPLAEGADRIFVESVWQVEPSAKLLVPIPFAKTRYMQDFDENSQKEFENFLQDSRCIDVTQVDSLDEKDYFTVGKFVVDHSDFMFFVYDGSPFEKMDGGTGSIMEYSKFNIHNSYEFKDKTISLPKTPYCWINPKDFSTKISIDEKDSFYTNSFSKYIEGIKPDFSTCKDKEDFKKKIDELNSKFFDYPSFLSQQKFGKQSVFIIGCAFLTGLCGLMDMIFPNFLFSKISHIFSWDWLEFIGLATILILALYTRKSNHLTQWLNKRYLAERLRYIMEYLNSDIPLSQVIKYDKNDPASEDLTKVWHSLYYCFYMEYKGKKFPKLEFEDFKKELLSQESLLYSQFDWHRRKIHQKSRQEFKYRWIKYSVLACSIILTLFAALQIGGTGFVKHWDLICGAISFLLASITANFEQKELGKIISRYRFTCEQFAEIYRNLHFCKNHESLQNLIIQGGDSLMETTYTWMYTMQAKDPDFS